MQNNLLRICMWILGISAVFGNLAVLIMRLSEKSANSVAAKQSLFIGNLAVSDCLMGIYMLILASADIYYGNQYFLYSDQWRSGTVCKIASFLGLLSSEASVFFITLISIDRFISLLFPFSRFLIRSTGSKLLTCILWLFALILAIVPTLYAGPDSDLYDLSDVCIGLPLITRPTSFHIESSIFSGASRAGSGNTGHAFNVPVPSDSKPAWIFSIAIFLGLNLVCFLAILICYIVIFASIRESRKQVKRAANVDEEIKIALKMAAVVGTDFICWFPVIVMGILSQTGLAVIPLEMYTWSVVFILPVNSSLNPYLYTLASLISDYKNKVKQEKGTISMTDLKGRSNFNSAVTESVNFQSQMD